jgi:LemA protein
MLFGVLVFGAILVIVFSFVTTYNRLVAVAEQATRAWNDLDVLLRQRHDEIPKLIEMCESHLTEERASLDRLLGAAAAVFAARSARDADALGRAERTTRGILADLIARTTSHPELAGNAAFALLRQRHATLDAEITERRERYNQSVRDYNAAKGRVPGNLVALIGQFPPLRPLETDPLNS